VVELIKKTDLYLSMANSKNIANQLSTALTFPMAAVKSAYGITLLHHPNRTYTSTARQS
jgi:hypothetical protein